MENFIVYFATIYVFMLSPGPSMALISRNAARYSIPPTLYTIYGILLSVSIYTIFSIVGIAALIETYPKALKIAKLIGSLYIGYIGVKIFARAKCASLKNGQNNEEKPSKMQMFLTGFTTDFSNPMTIVGLTSVIVLFVSPAYPLYAKFMYFALTILAGLLYGLTYAVLFGNSFFRAFIIPRLVAFERVAGSAVILIAIIFLYKVLVS